MKMVALPMRVAHLRATEAQILEDAGRLCALKARHWFL
jgi:hypothetical protein